MSKGIDKDVKLGPEEEDRKVVVIVRDKLSTDYPMPSDKAAIVLVFVLAAVAALVFAFGSTGNPRPKPLNAISLKECLAVCGDAGVSTFMVSPEGEMCQCRFED